MSVKASNCGLCSALAAISLVTFEYNIKQKIGLTV